MLEKAEQNQEAGMTSWASCSLDEEILAIIETDSPVTVRFLCALIYPGLSWGSVQHQIDAVRHHCEFLVRSHLIKEIDVDTYVIVRAASA